MIGSAFFFTKFNNKKCFFKLPQHTPYPFKRKNTANQQEVQYKKVYNTAPKEKRVTPKTSNTKPTKKARKCEVLVWVQILYA